MKMPEINKPVNAVLQHWYTKRTITAELIAVVGYNWKTTDDNSELSYDWDVIGWEYVTKKRRKAKVL